MADDVLKIFAEGRVDAQSLSGFMEQPSDALVPRRLAPPINTLNYFLDYLRALELVYSQQTGVVNVNGVQVKAITQAVKDALNSAAIDNNTQVDTLITVTPKDIGQVAQNLAQVVSERASVKKWGVIGGGVDGYSARFQAAVDAQAAGDKLLYLPKDTYALSGIDLKGVTLIGDDATIISDGNTSNRYIFTDSTTDTVKLKNIIFNGFSNVKDTGDVWQRSFYFANNRNVVLDEVDFISCPGGVGEFGANVKSVSIKGGNVFSCTDSNGFIIRAQHSIINGMTFKDCAEHVIRFGRFNNDADVDSGKYSTVSNCSFYNIGNDAILFEINSSHGIVTGCVAENIRSLVKCETSDTVTESQKARRIIVKGNICVGAIGVVSACIKLNNSEQSIVTNNIIQGFYDGINAGKNSVISNNVLQDIANQAIRPLGANVSVSTNNIKTAKVGIVAADFADISITGNFVEGCETGIAAIAPDTWVSSNKVNNNNIGIRAYGTALNSVIAMNKGKGNTTPISNVLSASNISIKMNFGDLAASNQP